jgi:hypothetical protein
MADENQIAKDVIKNTKMDKKIKDRLTSALSLAGSFKTGKFLPPAQKAGISGEFLDDKAIEKIQKDEFKNFEVIDYDGRFVLIPDGHPITPEVITLLKQLIKANPKALYTRQVSNPNKVDLTKFPIYGSK